jgi:hypothetical protein
VNAEVGVWTVVRANYGDGFVLKGQAAVVRVGCERILSGGASAGLGQEE